MNWAQAWERSFVAVRDQLRRERQLGRPPRRAGATGLGVDMRDFSDSEIDRYARREAERRTQEAINREAEQERQRAA